MTPLALSALTDVVLASEVFFLAGLSCRPGVAWRSPAGWWAVTMVLMALAPALGAIDHGFFEPIAHPAHYELTVATRATAALASFTMLMATAGQFLAGRLYLALLVLGFAGLVATVGAIVFSDNFFSLVIYYSLILLITLGFHLRGLRHGSGSAAMCLGIAGVLIASAALPIGFELPVLGLYATYHVLLMPAVILLYLGGRRLRGSAGARGAQPAAA